MCIVSIPFPFVLCGGYFNEQNMLEVVMDVLCCVLCIEVNKASKCREIENKK